MSFHKLLPKQPRERDDIVTPIYIFLFSIMYLLIFVPLPYVAYKKKHYKILSALGISSAVGYWILAVDPLFPVGELKGMTFKKVMMIFVLPVYLIGLLSWVVLTIKTKKKKTN